MPGNTAELIFLASSSSLVRMRPPRGPRSVLWVVVVTTCACGNGEGWAPPATSPAASLTYQDIDGRELHFPPGCLQRPLKRVLCLQARLAKKEAALHGWRQLEFEDFWSEGEHYLRIMNLLMLLTLLMSLLIMPMKRGIYKF